MTTYEELLGLLKPSPEEQKRALGLGLLNFGAGTLANNYGHYGALGPAIGAGLQSGIQGYTVAQQNSRQNRLGNLGLKLKLDELQKEQEKLKQTQDLVGSLGQPTYSSGLNYSPGQGLQLGNPNPIPETPQARQAKMQQLAFANPALATAIHGLDKPTDNMPWYVKKGPNGQTIIDPAFSELEKTKAAYGRPPAQPMAPVAYVDDKGKVVWGTINEAKGHGAANFMPSIQGDISRARKAGEGAGEADTSLAAAQASYPQLETTVNYLKTLGKDATYTVAGQARDVVARQMGIATTGAIAREKYTQTVRDVLFPQLRQTFGAQFTVKEGEALIATMGDPNKTPQEKNAALDSFIEQKKLHIESLQRQTSGENSSKTVTLADIAATAKASGKTTAEVTAALKAKGYTIK